MFGADPLVQATETDPLAFRAVDAFATTGSYAPKATAVVLIVQLAVTDAVTDRLAGALPAWAGDAESIAAPTPRRDASIKAFETLLSFIETMRSTPYVLYNNKRVFSNLSLAHKNL